MIINLSCGDGNNPHKKPAYTYTGKSKEIIDGNTFYIEFLTSGTLTINKLNCFKKGVDIFALGSGASGNGGLPGGTGNNAFGGSGGNGGGSHTVTQQVLKQKIGYKIDIGWNTSLSDFNVLGQGGKGAGGGRGGYVESFATGNPEDPVRNVGYRAGNGNRGIYPFGDSNNFEMMGGSGGGGSAYGNGAGDGGAGGGGNGGEQGQSGFAATSYGAGGGGGSGRRNESTGGGSGTRGLAIMRGFLN